MSVLEILGLSRRRRTGGEAALLAAIDARLEHVEPDRARYIAGFAGALGLVAAADDHVSDAECRAMTELVQVYGGLTRDESAVIVEAARSHASLLGTDSRLLRDLCALTTREQRQRMLHCLFAVAAADHVISRIEESRIRRIGERLDLTRDDFETVRSAYEQKLEPAV